MPEIVEPAIPVECRKDIALLWVLCRVDGSGEKFLISIGPRWFGPEKIEYDVSCRSADPFKGVAEHPKTPARNGARMSSRRAFGPCAQDDYMANTVPLPLGFVGTSAGGAGEIPDIAEHLAAAIDARKKLMQ